MIFVMVAFCVSPAYAQDYTLKVTNDELTIISDGLMTQPYGKVAPLITKLREQYIAQQPKPVPPKSTETPEKQDASPQAN